MRTSPSLSHPIVPAGLEPNGLTLWVCSLRTKRAAWISSAKTTMQPIPRVLSSAAARTAASRFAGPSAPGSDGLRIAPVTTTGASPATRRSSAKAVSSSVSVPCVTTTPASPEAMHLVISSASAITSATVSSGDGSCLNVSAVIRAVSPSAGRLATSCSAGRAGVTPVPSALTDAIVPPSASTRTRGSGSPPLMRRSRRP